MGLNLPNARSVFLPDLPPVQDAQLKEYLKKMSDAIRELYEKQFDNTYYILSTGTAGTFTASNGDTVTVSNGIITSLT